MKKGSTVTVAEYLTQQIDLSGRPQKEIAEALGYDKPNIITMFKQGKTKIPLNKIAPLARAVGVDPVHFLRLAMLEYSPETWAVLESLIGNAMMSANEERLLSVVRKASRGLDLPPIEKEMERELTTLVSSWADRHDALAKAAAEGKPRRS